MFSKPMQFALWLFLSLYARDALASDLVVVGHPSAPALTKEQVAEIFLGKNQTRNPVDLAEGSPIRAEFYKRATGRELAQVKAVWSRLVFSAKGVQPKEYLDAEAVKKAVAADPKSIGYIEKSAVDASVKVLTSVE